MYVRYWLLSTVVRALYDTEALIQTGVASGRSISLFAHSTNPSA